MNAAETRITALRQQWRSDVSDQRQWTLATDLATAVSSANAETVGGLALRRLAHEWGAAHGLLARVHPARLDIVASVGVAPPEHARLALTGALGAVARWPARTLMRADATNSAWCIGRRLAFEVLIPLAFDQRVVGLLALAAEPGTPPPDSAGLRTFEIVSAWLAPWLAGGGTSKSRLNDPDRRLLDQLTPRERQVMALLPRGMTNAELAQSLGIAPGTVKIHIERILRKLHLRDRAQAAARAVEWKLGGSA